MNRRNAAAILLFVWGYFFVSVVRAATMAEVMGQYDETLLQWMAATALLGGMIRTILSLQSDARVVRDIATTALWDAVKSLVVGMFVFIAVQALRSWGYPIPIEVRFSAVLVAGWHRMSALDWISTTGKRWIDRKVGADREPLPTSPPKDAP